jgi:membrane-bound metal-dependent hydrolase YbcI (DUF457 family)
MLSLILLILAFLLFLIAALIVPPNEPWRAKLGLLGLAAWVLAEIVLRAANAGKFAAGHFFG